MILTLDLTNCPQDAVNRMKREISDSLLKDDQYFKKEMVEYWGRVSDDNETKKQMLVWCNAGHSLYIQSTKLYTGLNQFDLTNVSPGGRRDFENLLNKQLNTSYYYLQEDIGMETVREVRDKMRFQLQTLWDIRVNMLNQFGGRYNGR